MRTLREWLRRVVSPVHPFARDLFAYMRLLREEGRRLDNRILTRLAQPQGVEDFVGFIAERSYYPGIEAIDTIVVSDIHLGSKHSLAPALHTALSRFTFKRLVLNGDIFDHLNFDPAHLTGEIEGVFPESHRAFIRTLRDLSATHEVVWIRGNHDDALAMHMAEASLGVAHHEYSWEFDGKRYLALHGDQFDRFSHESPVLYAIGTKFYLFLQRMGPWTRGFCQRLKRTTKLYTKALDFVTHGALDYARNKRADVVVCGHTHQVRHATREGVRYVNSGSWTEATGHFITIGERGVRLHTFSDQGAHLAALVPAGI